MLIPVVVIILFVSFILLYQFFIGNRNELRKLRKEWDEGNFLRLSEDVNSLSSYWENKKNASGNYDGVDQFTWDDLSMQEVFEKINYTKSSVGSEYLFNQLRDINLNPTDIRDKESLYQLFEQDQSLREKVLLILSGLGKRNFSNTSAYFYQLNDKGVKYAYLYVILACLPFISILFMIFNLKYGVFSLFVSFILNLTIYYRHKKHLENNLHSITYVAAIINTGKSLASITHPKLSVFRDIFDKDGRKLKRTSFWGKLLSIGSNKSGDLDVFYEYIRIVFLLDFIAYNQIVKTMVTYKYAYKKLWESIGALDAAIAVAFYRKSLSTYTTPVFIDNEQLHFEDLAHPLLRNPVTNSSTLDKSVLITGSNASGKSTYIKAIAINAIFAQTINTVLAKKWVMKPSYIVTSMAIKDNVLDGDSYFIAEIKSLKRIIKLSEDKKPMIAFIDEILKGTNTIERISASASIMEWLANNKGMTVLASHDIELTEITRTFYKNFHFRESIEHNKVFFDYKVHEGPSMTRNAIKLLEVIQYPTSITNQANQLAESFTGKREWQRLTK